MSGPIPLEPLSHPTTAPEQELSRRPLDFRKALLRAPEFVSLEIPPRPLLLKPWLREGDMGYLFAPRGAGKTWMALLISKSVSEGSSLGEWEAGESPRPVYYFDAEMNLADTQARFRILGIDNENFHLLSNERLHADGQRGVDIANPEHQEALSAMLPNGALFVIDNLSTSQIGMKENDNDSFDAIRDWLLSLRHRGITVLIVHHAGRNGSMRGGSRREDMAHWILSLKGSCEDGEESPILEMATSFTPPAGKYRSGPQAEAISYKWTVRTSAKPLEVDCRPFSGPDALLCQIEAGVSSATELAEIMGVSTGTVSKWAKKLMEQGKIKKDGRDYVSL